MALKSCKCGKGYVSCDGYNIYYKGKFRQVRYLNESIKEIKKMFKDLAKLNHTQKENYTYKKFINHKIVKEAQKRIK